MLTRKESDELILPNWVFPNKHLFSKADPAKAIRSGDITVQLQYKRKRDSSKAMEGTPKISGEVEPNLTSAGDRTAFGMGGVTSHDGIFPRSFPVTRLRFLQQDWPPRIPMPFKCVAIQYKLPTFSAQVAVKSGDVQWTFAKLLWIHPFTHL
jgi:hypothetical protein